MKRCLALAAVLVIALAACGGSSSSSNTGGTIPTPTSNATKHLTASLMFSQFDMVGAIMNSIGGAAQVIKETSPTITCSQVNSTTYSCTATDSVGGTANLTATLDEATSTMTVVVESDGFHPESDTVVDGSYTLTAWVDQSVYMSASAGAQTAIDASPSKSTDDLIECEVDDDTLDPEGLCAETTQICTQQDATVYMTITIGSEGLTVTDPCGTYTWAAGTTMTAAFCGDLSSSAMPVILTFTMNGTFNGQTVNETFSIECDFSSI